MHCYFMKSKGAKILRIDEVLINSKSLRYLYCKCVRYMLRKVTFVTGKLKLASFSLFLEDPRCPSDNEMSLPTYTYYVKGILV